MSIDNTEMKFDEKIEAWIEQDGRYGQDLVRFIIFTTAAVILTSTVVLMLGLLIHSILNRE